MPGSAPRDENRVPGLIAKSDADNEPVIVEADPVTKRLKTNTTLTGSEIPISGATTGVGVAILDGSGNQITSFGGGAQYTQDDFDTTPTGTVMMFMRDDGTGQIVTPSDNNPLPIQIPNGLAGSGLLTDAELRASAVPVSVSGVATAAAQTDGTQKIQIVDAGGDAVTVTGGKLDVNSAAPVGGATEAKQDSQITLATQLETLTETLQELVQRLAPLAGAMRNTAQLGVIGSVAVTSAPSTAVTGPITSAQSIAEKAVAGISYPEKVAITNLTAIQSNINNAVAA